jgi:hypothetical protein
MPRGESIVNACARISAAPQNARLAQTARDWHLWRRGMFTISLEELRHYKGAFA